MTIEMKHLTQRQQRAWIMRYRYGWRLTQIAVELNRSPAGVSRLLRRARMAAGLGASPYQSVIRKAPRERRAVSLEPGLGV